ncbi:MAG: hypothetical protein MSG64_13710 [Pyrinomonadaceae bacterium MAG19_C2-C3]|nr:hypothetical protein [Pyrinomonadaceae bacterium MAG19_C2-C3]
MRRTLIFTIFIFALHLSLTSSVRAQDARQGDSRQRENYPSHTTSNRVELSSPPLAPGATLRRARTLYIEPGRRIDREYVQYKLLKTSQLAAWNITIVEDARAADLILRLDQKLANYLFVIVDPRTTAVVVSGKVVAINDPVAADLLGVEIIKRMREVRGAD